MIKDSQKWDARYLASECSAAKPVWVLNEFQHLLPKTGQALELASGLGGNAQLLASKGLAVTAWDISAVAVDKLNACARERGLSIRAEVLDLEHATLPRGCFDVICVSYFLYRPLFQWIQQALNPGGLLFYQTFTAERLADAPGPRTPEFLLRSNELLRSFEQLHIRIYREEGLLGDTRLGLRNEAALVAQKKAEPSV